MMRYLLQPRDRIFIKGFGYLPFAKNIGKNIDKTTSKNLSGKHSLERLGAAKKICNRCTWNFSKKSNSKNYRSNYWFDW